jgi:hypothetical protein
MTKAFVYGVSIIHLGKVPQQTVIVMTAAAVTILIWISIVAMIILQTVFANKDEGNPSSSTDDCKSDQLPAGIDGKISCMGQGECYSEDFEVDGKEVRHCNFMMSTK